MSELSSESKLSAAEALQLQTTELPSTSEYRQPSLLGAELTETERVVLQARVKAWSVFKHHIQVPSLQFQYVCVDDESIIHEDSSRHGALAHAKFRYEAKQYQPGELLIRQVHLTNGQPWPGRPDHPKDLVRMIVPIEFGGPLSLQELLTLEESTPGMVHRLIQALQSLTRQEWVNYIRRRNPDAAIKQVRMLISSHGVRSIAEQDAGMDNPNSKLGENYLKTERDWILYHLLDGAENDSLERALNQQREQGLR